MNSVKSETTQCAFSGQMFNGDKDPKWSFLQSLQTRTLFLCFQNWRSYVWRWYQIVLSGVRSEAMSAPTPPPNKDPKIYLLRRKVRLSHKSGTVAEFRRFLRQSHFCETVPLFCDSVDRLLEFADTLPHIEFSLYKNSCVNRCLFAMVSQPYVIVFYV